MRHLFTTLFAILLFFTASGRNAFIENKGQVTDQYRKPNSQVLYLYNSQQLNVQLRKNGFSYDIWQQEVNGDIHVNRIDIDFVNASTAISTQCSGRSADVLNYYTEYTGEKGITGVHSYEKVLYKNVWAYIDIEFLLSGDKPKYNFILHPGAKLTDIKLDIKGANSITQNGNGLSISTAITTFNETLPHSYFMQATDKTEVTAKLYANNDGTYGISVLQNIPPNAMLVIDPMPTVQWGTFYGATAYDNIEAIAIDTIGYVYVVGTTNSSAAIATAGAHEITYQGGTYDAFVAKFNAAGVRTWGTYYGGSAEDYGMSIAIEPGGLNLYTAGYTLSSAGIATIGSHQEISGNNTDAYLAKFDSSGQRIWATYYGGSNIDEARCVAVDAANNVYLSGDTRSGSGIATPGSYQPVHNGVLDGFIAKFTPTGNRIWGTFWGGENEDNLNSINIVNDRIYIAGETASFTNISSPGAFQPTKNGQWEGFIAKLDTAGTTRIWSTYYGGLGLGHEGDLTATVDENANIYVTGFTQSPGMATAGTYQLNPSGSNDGFIARFDSSGMRVWGTYYGGSDNDHPTAITYARGHIYIAGYTSSFSGIATPNAVQTAMNGGNRHVMIAKFDTTGNIKWGTYYYRGEAYALAANDEGVYVAGGSQNPGASTPGSHQPVHGGWRDAFLLKLNTCDIGFATASANNPVIVNGTINLQAGGGTQYFWSHPGGFSSNMQNPTITNAKLTDSGTYTVLVTDKYSCTDTAKVNVQFTTSVNDVLAKTFHVYPNPSATYVTVENTDGLAGTIDLLTLEGRSVYSTQLAEKQQKIDISKLSTGIYMINIITPRGAATIKLLKE